MTPASRAALRRLCEAATSGPWQVIAEPVIGDDGQPIGYGVIERRIFTAWDHPQLQGPVGVVNGSYVVRTKQPHKIHIEAADADFIAACRTAAPELLTALDRAEAQILLLAMADDKADPVVDAARRVSRSFGESDMPHIDDHQGDALGDLAAALADLDAHSRSAGQAGETKE